MALSSVLTGGLLDVGAKLIDRLIPDPEQKAKAQLELLDMEQKGELSALSTRMSAILAEAQSKDPWTSRARPAFMYVFYIVILSLVLLAPAVGVFFPHQMTHFFSNVESGFEAIPEEMWWVFTAGYLGYATNRTFEKRKGVAK